MKGKERERDDTKSSSKWTDADDATLVQTLTKEKADGNWGDNNPKKCAWTACEKALRGSEEASGGAPKLEASIKNRWQKVSTCVCMRIYYMFLIFSSSKQNTRRSKSSVGSQALDGMTRRCVSQLRTACGLTIVR